VQAADILIDEATMLKVGAVLADIIIRACRPANGDNRFLSSSHPALYGAGSVSRRSRASDLSMEMQAWNPSIHVQPPQSLDIRSSRMPLTPAQSLKDDLVQAQQDGNHVSMQRLLGKTDSAGASSSLSQAFHQQRVFNVRAQI
jgi:hypothetical protein